MNIHQAQDRFLEHLKIIKNASPHTVRNYAIDLAAFCEFIKEPLSVETISKYHLRGFLADLSEKITRKSVLRKLSTLRSFFKYCAKNNWCSQNPVDQIETPKLEKKLPKALSSEQITRLMAAPDLECYLGFRDRAILELLYSSGLRNSELVGVNREDLSFKEHLLKVRGKGKKERIVPLTKTAVKWIADYLNHPERHEKVDNHEKESDKEAVFLNKWGKRLSSRSLDRNFKLLLHKSGIAGEVTPHTLRHSIATHLLSNGMDLKTIQKILGHSSLTTTTIYTKVCPETKKKVYKESHPRS